MIPLTAAYSDQLAWEREFAATVARIRAQEPRYPVPYDVYWDDERDEITPEDAAEAEADRRWFQHLVR